MLTLWRPERELFRWSRDLDDFFGWGSRNGERRGLAPAVDIEEKEDRFVLHADLPGVGEKDIEVTVHEGVLTLSGQREESKERETERGALRERRYGAFHRRFRLGTNVASEKIEATYRNGVLTVVLPKKEEAKPRLIPVSATS